MLADGGGLDLVEAAARHAPQLLWLDLRANPLLTAEGTDEAVAAAEHAHFDLLL